jgi:hypothetical protein
VMVRMSSIVRIETPLDLKLTLTCNLIEVNA